MCPVQNVTYLSGLSHPSGLAHPIWPGEAEDFCQGALEFDIHLAPLLAGIKEYAGDQPMQNRYGLTSGVIIGIEGPLEIVHASAV